MKRKPVQEANRKPDSLRKSEIPERIIANQRIKEMHLFPLRINRQTVIYVTRDKCTDSYRQRYIAKLQRLKPSEIHQQQVQAMAVETRKRNAKELSYDERRN